MKRLISAIMAAAISWVASAQDIYELGALHIAEGNNHAAWSLLYPKAQRGDAKAAGMLWVLLSQSGASENHQAMSERLLEIARRGNAQTLTTSLQAEMSNATFDTAHRFFGKAGPGADPAQLVMPETNDGQESIEQQTLIELYIQEEAVLPESVLTTLLQLQRTLARAVDVRIRVVRHLPSAEESSTFGDKELAIAVMADIDGLRAAELGVTSFPSIVVTSTSGATRVYSNKQFLEALK